MDEFCTCKIFNKTTENSSKHAFWKPCLQNKFCPRTRVFRFFFTGHLPFNTTMGNTKIHLTHYIEHLSSENQFTKASNQHRLLQALTKMKEAKKQEFFRENFSYFSTKKTMKCHDTPVFCLSPINDHWFKRTDAFASPNIQQKVKKCNNSPIFLQKLLHQNSAKKVRKNWRKIIWTKFCCFIDQRLDSVYEYYK